MGNSPTASDAATSSRRDETAHRLSASTIIVAPRPTADSKRANRYAQMTNDRYEFEFTEFQFRIPGIPERLKNLLIRLPSVSAKIRPYAGIVSTSYDLNLGSEVSIGSF